MKKLFRTMIAVAVAAAAMTSCAKEMQEIVQENGVPFQVTMQGPDTKAIFGTAESSKYPVLWQEGDEVKVMALKTPGSKTDVAVVEGKKYKVTVANEGKSASFTAECPAAATAPYQFFVLSPNSAFVSCGDDATNKDYIQYTVPASQTPTATSVDPAAIITLGVSTQSADIPGAINLTFKHLTAYGLLTLNNLTTGGKAVKSISLTFDESLGISGRWMYHPSTDATNVNNKGNVITVNTDKTENVYFSCAPVDISGTKITVTVAVEGSNLIKEITVPADKAFKAGTVSKFAIDMTGATEEAAKVFAPVAVSDLSTLKAGDQLIIASVGEIGTMGRVACSTTQATANRTGISVSSLINEEGKLVNPTSGIQIVTLKAGTIEGCFLLEVGEGQYLYCPGVTKKNHLKTTTDLVTDNDAANWKIYADGEKTRIASQVKSDWAGDAKPNRIYIEFNKDDGKCSSYPIDSQSAACLFRLEDTPEPPKELKIAEVKVLTTGDAAWSSGFTTSQDFRNVAMDDDYIYLAEFNGTKKVWALKKDDFTATPVSNGTIASASSYDIYTACPRIMKNTNASINGGKDVLLVSNLGSGGDYRLYVYDNGIASDPSVITLSGSGRLGDTFTTYGTFEKGILFYAKNGGNGVVTFQMNGVVTGTRYLVNRLALTTDAACAYHPFPEDFTKGILAKRAEARGQSVVVNATETQIWNTWDTAFEATATNLEFAEGRNGYVCGYNFMEFNGKRYVIYGKRQSAKEGRVYILEGETTDSWVSILNTADVKFRRDFSCTSGNGSTHSGMDVTARIIGDELYIAAVYQNVGLGVWKMYLE